MVHLKGGINLKSKAQILNGENEGIQNILGLPLSIGNRSAAKHHLKKVLQNIPGRSVSSFPAFSKNIASIKKQAPNMTAFMRTSKSMGKVIPK